MNRDLFLVAISLFFWGIGEGMFTYFQPIYLSTWGASPILIGTIMGAMGIAILLFQIPAGALSDKFGSRPLMWGSWLFGALSSIVMAWAGSLAVFVIGLLMYGLTSFVLAPMNSYISARKGKWSVARAITFTTALFNFGMVIGPTLGGYIGESFGLTLVYKISSGFLVISTVLILFVSPIQAEEHHSTLRSFKSIRQNQPFLWLLLIAFFVSFATYLPQPLSPNFLQEIRGLDLSQVGRIGSLGSLGSALVALVLGHLNPVIGIMAGQGLMAIFSVCIWGASSQLLLAIGYLFIGGFKLSRAMLLAVGRHITSPGNTGLVFGLLETANALAMTLAPVLAGLLYSRRPVSVYPVSLGVLLSVSVFSFFAFKNLPRLSLQEPAEPFMEK